MDSPFDSVLFWVIARDIDKFSWAPALFMLQVQCLSFHTELYPNVLSRVGMTGKSSIRLHHGLLKALMVL